MGKIRQAILALTAAVILTSAVSVWAYWDAILMYAAPQIPINEAFWQVCSALEARYQESPLPILLKGYDEGGLQTAQVELLTPDRTAKGSLNLQTDLKNNQILLEGTLPPEIRLGGISLYLDRDRAAFTSDRLLAGGYYGITYETFQSDIRSIPLVSRLVPDTFLQQMGDFVSVLKGRMDWEIELPAIPTVDAEALKQLPLALWALRSQVSTTETSINGTLVPCFQVVYTIEGETAEFLWRLISNDPFPENGMVQLTFFLHVNALVKMELHAASKGMQIAGALTLGEHPKTDALILEITPPDGIPFITAIRQEGEWRNIRFGSTDICYQWDNLTGNMVLGRSGPVALTLTGGDDGFTIETAELSKLVKSDLFSDCLCIASVKRGAEITPPEYKNLSQWSIQDLLIFTEGIWTVIKP